ncbi:MAG: hypothetical protein JWQ49_4150 [Edaphobacter sp.]|nr:hypothetical protein [Edaphobacter sp.]
MTDQQFEYRQFNLDLASVPRSPGYSPLATKAQISFLLQPMGDEAWEVTYVKRGRSLAEWVEAKRPPYGVPAPSSWEYIGFNMFGMPHPDWDHHTESRGWVKVPDIWFAYYFHEWWLYKRPDCWRGSDDGDIMAQLYAMGAHFGGGANLSFSDGRSNSEIGIEAAVRDILGLKCHLSEQVGCDVGTYTAVKRWLEKL